MINARKFGGGYCLSAYQKGGQALNCFPIRLPKGGLRWTDTSDKGGVIYG